MSVLDILANLLDKPQDAEKSIRASEKLQRTMESLQKDLERRESKAQINVVSNAAEARNIEAMKKIVADKNVSAAQEKYRMNFGTAGGSSARADLDKAENAAALQNKALEAAEKNLEAATKDLTKVMRDLIQRGPLSSMAYKQQLSDMQRQEQKELADKKSLFRQLAEGYSEGRSFRFGGGGGGGRGGAGGAGAAGEAAGFAGAAGMVAGAGVAGLSVLWRFHEWAVETRAKQHNLAIAGQEDTVAGLREVSPVQRALQMREQFVNTVMGMQRGAALGGTQDIITQARMRLSTVGQGAATDLDTIMGRRALEETQARERAARGLDRMQLEGIERADKDKLNRAVQLQLGRRLSEASSDADREKIFQAATKAGIIKEIPGLQTELIKRWGDYLKTESKDTQPQSERLQQEEERKKYDRAAQQSVIRALKWQKDRQAAEAKLGEINASIDLDPLGPGGIGPLLRGKNGERTHMERGYMMGRGVPWYEAYGQEPRFRTD